MLSTAEMTHVNSLGNDLGGLVGEETSEGIMSLREARFFLQTNRTSGVYPLTVDFNAEYY